MKLKEFIKQYREANHLSQRDFAMQCGISHGTVSLLEKGFNPQTGKPITQDMGTMRKIANGMGMSVNMLLEQVYDDNLVITSKPFTGRIDAGELHRFMDAKTPDEPRRLYVNDSSPLRRVEDKELDALIKIWKVATPEKRKSIIRVIKALSEEE